MAEVSLTKHQLEGLDKLIARGKDLKVDDLPADKFTTDCWLDTGVQTAIIATMVAGCAQAQVKPELDDAGKKVFTLQQLKDLRRRAS